MRKKDIRQYYRCWGFWEKVPLVSREDQWLSYFNQKFADIDIDTDEICEAIEATLNETLDVKVDEVQSHIDEAKEFLCTDICTAKDEIENAIDESNESIKAHIDETAEDVKNTLSCKIRCAKTEIENHIDAKIDPIHFEEQFSNLNEQVLEILRKLDNN